MLHWLARDGRHKNPALRSTMPFTALHAVHKDTGELVLTLHLVPAAQEEQAAWEEVVAAATRELWNSSAGAGPAFAAAG